MEKHSEKGKVMKQLWSLKMKIIQSPENGMTNQSHGLKAPWKRSEGEARGRRDRRKIKCQERTDVEVGIRGGEGR